VSDATEERVRESEKTQVQVVAMRETYRPVAVRGAIVYFGIADMATVDPMYQYSLGYVSSCLLCLLLVSHSMIVARAQHKVKCVSLCFRCVHFVGYRYFKRLFAQCLRDAPQRSSAAERVAELVSYQVLASCRCGERTPSFLDIANFANTLSFLSPPSPCLADHCHLRQRVPGPV
jgi:hypothetical protein